MTALYVGLVHHPVRDRSGAVMASAVTNIDVHDIARSCCTYGVAKYFVITPIAAQKLIIDRILHHWSKGDGARRMPERSLALSHCAHAESIDVALQEIEGKHQCTPQLWVTEARPELAHKELDYPEARVRLIDATAPTLLLFGTAHGLHESVLHMASATLKSIDARADVQTKTASGYAYNHLSVRAAVAITLDRLRGL